MSKSWGEIRDEALRRCGQLPPQTNADRIRAMTDEELAHILATHDCYDCILDEYHVCESVDGRCGSERVLNWLKQEVNNDSTT